jgi:hypothetical protein
MQNHTLSSSARRARDAGSSLQTYVRTLLCLLVLALWSACTTTDSSSGDEGDDTLDGQSQALAQPRIIGPKATQKRVVWVMMKDQANLSVGNTASTWRAKGQVVAGALANAASRSQPALKTWLAQRGAKVKPFWIVNALKVEADGATIEAIKRRPDVKQVMEDKVYSLPPVSPGKTQARINALEWGLQNIRAQEAWDAFGAKGEGIVIANLDTGVQFDHPALVRQYRGTQADGTFDHNYNWADPSNECGSPSLVPCDDNDHGTHTMGTMVGDDGAGNQIGVAPGARWIAAKGCGSFGCSLEQLLGSAEWFLAPTDLNGQNPRPDLRPHIINNSWGGGPGDPFYQAAVEAWVAAGIFPAFANGNDGASCSTAGSPGDYPSVYAVGAYDINNMIAPFSSRGPGFDGIVKPNISAPGVNVRSSVTGSGYRTMDGTSMATPHLSGAIALMWSAAPTLLGDIATTRAILDETAIDTEDTSCGGDAANNNVFGQGRLDAFAAVDASPRGPTGLLAGTVTNAADGAPLARVSITARNSEGRTRTAVTDANGTFSMRLAVGSYELTAQAFGFVATSASASVSEGQTTTVDFALQAAPSHSLSGTIVDDQGQPLENVKVILLGTPLEPAVTDAEGQYSFPSVPDATYQLRVDASKCSEGQTVSVTIADDVTLDFSLAARVDGFGYRCRPVEVSYIDGVDVIASESDDGTWNIDLPFPVTFYGQSYTTATVSVNGTMAFNHNVGIPFFNSEIPSSEEPNAAIYAYWDDLYLLNDGAIRTTTVGEAPNRSFVVEWHNAALYADTSKILNFEIVIHESGDITINYENTDTVGGDATSGIENETGDIAFQYSYREPVLTGGTGIRYIMPPIGFVAGVVTDANDGLPVEGALVRALVDGSQVRTTYSDAQGQYRLALPEGSYTIEASKAPYESQEIYAVVGLNDTFEANFALASAAATLTPPAIEIVSDVGQVHERELVLSSHGSSALTWTLNESGGQLQAVTSTSRLARSAKKGRLDKDTRGLLAGRNSGWKTAAAGDLLASFYAGEQMASWGVGYTGNVWLSGGESDRTNYEYFSDGWSTGNRWSADWAGDWAADMAYVSMYGLMCQLAVGGDNGIHCWDAFDGVDYGNITGDWSLNSQRGLAYRADDDSFYVGGWNEGAIHHVAGFGAAVPGELLGTCYPSDGNIAGLAFNNNTGSLWMVSNSDTDTIYELNPDDCMVRSTLAHPAPGYNGAGLELDESGNLWTAGQQTNVAYLIEGGAADFNDVEWLYVSDTEGTLQPGSSQTISVTIDTTGLAPGTYLAALYLDSNSGRSPRIRVPVSLVVTSYRQAIDTGSTRSYTDANGVVWAADQLYRSGSWGYMQRSSTVTTTRNIAGTTEQALFRSQRVDPYSYRFDSVPNGVYQVEVGFAELTNARPGQRLFDVIIENENVLPAHDISYSVGTFRADRQTFYVYVADGRLDVRFIGRASLPVVNSLSITHRPDL